MEVFENLIDKIKNFAKNFKKNSNKYPYTMQFFIADIVFVICFIILCNAGSLGLSVFMSFVLLIDYLISSIVNEHFPLGYILERKEKIENKTDFSEHKPALIKIHCICLIIVVVLGYINSPLITENTSTKTKAPNGRYYDSEEWHVGHGGYMYNKDGYCDDNGNGHIDSDDIYGNGKGWNWLD